MAISSPTLRNRDPRRSLILRRSEAEMRDRRLVRHPHVVLKEPTGSQAADLIGSLSPDSSVVFLCATFATSRLGARCGARGRMGRAGARC